MSIPPPPSAPFAGPSYVPPSFDSDDLSGFPSPDAPRRQKKSRAKKVRTPKETQPREPKPATRRVANVNRTVGIVLAVLATLLVILALHTKPKDLYVVRASTPLSALTPFSLSDVSAYATTPANVEDGAITATSASKALKKASKELKGSFTQYPLVKGEQITPDLFSDDQTSAPVLVGPTQRLMAIQADIGASAAGVRAGSYVDVVAVTTATSPALAGVVLSHVEVVDVAPPSSALESSATSSSSAKVPASSIGGTYVLLIPAREETRLAVVAAGGSTTLYLTYDNPQSTTPNAAVTSVVQAVCGINDPLHESGSTVNLPAACS